MSEGAVGADFTILHFPVVEYRIIHMSWYVKAYFLVCFLVAFTDSHALALLCSEIKW